MAETAPQPGAEVRSVSQAVLACDTQHGNMYIAALALERDQGPCWRTVESRPPSTSTEGQCHHRVQVCSSHQTSVKLNPLRRGERGCLLYITDCCYCPCGESEHLCILEPQPQPRGSRCHFGLHTTAISCQPHQLTTRLLSKQVPGSREYAAFK